MGIGDPTCDVCGEGLPEGAYFCGECGASVPEFGTPIDTSARRVEPPATTAPAAAVAPPVVAAPDLAQPVAVAPVAPEPVAAAPVVAEQVAVAPVVAEPVVVAPVVAEPLPAASPAAVVTPFTLVFSTGERAQVVGRGLIGRMPVAPANETWDHLIVVSDPSKTVSKTHLRVEALAQGLMVTDLDSANGTVVSMPGIAAERLAPHERVILMSGATVGIGDQSFTVQ